MPINQHIRIGTRGSDLALWQANFVKGELEKLGCTVEIKIIKTQGDLIQDLSFDKLEGKGFFTKEIEEALIANEIDLAVHSHKDLETSSPVGLMIAAVSDRENPAELLLIRKEAHAPNETWELKKNAVIGSSSARRKSQVLSLRPDLQLKDLRGNVPTRIDKLRKGEYDAILLAKAGVNRLGLDLEDLIQINLSPREFIPAPSQGVLGYQIRTDDVDLSLLLRNLNNEKIENEVKVERKVLQLMNGGCQLPLGVYFDGKFVYVSYAQSSLSAARYFKFEYSNDIKFAEKIVAHLKNI
ncbi:MAG: hydroxymethylbilane synthase [Flavobacteriia bacterium]|nr:hydroxymethylbilane synthase [Flavobacteriia bacterium]